MQDSDCVSPIIKQPVYLDKDTAIGPGSLLSSLPGVGNRSQVEMKPDGTAAFKFHLQLYILSPNGENEEVFVC